MENKDGPGTTTFTFSSDKIGGRVTYIAGGAVLAGVTVPVIIIAAGFGTGGVVAGSIAAGFQSSIGNVAAGSLFAALQSAGTAPLVSAGVSAAVVSIGGSSVVVVQDFRDKYWKKADPNPLEPESDRVLKGQGPKL